jgi:thiol-disulfide isomerase/thioredoxin
MWCAIAVIDRPNSPPHPHFLIIASVARLWSDHTMITHRLPALFLATLLTTAGACPQVSAQDDIVSQQTAPPVNRLPIEGNFPSLGGATTWLNSPPLTAKSLRGKPVVIDFWTYTCVNWRRTLPYLRAWAEKYKQQGLVVIGVHTPEFDFEKNLDNIRQAATEMGVPYPIAVDSDRKIWQAFNNEYWPALYLIDAQGHIRYHQFGEGEYARSEEVIQQLLTEAGSPDVPHGLVTVDPRGAEVAADWSNVQSPETYIGYEHTETFASPGGAALARDRVYAIPSQLRLNQWALAGNWKVQSESVQLSKAGGRIAFQFHARDLNLVMGSGARGSTVRFRVLIDGRPPGAAHGVDVDEQGYGTVAEPRMYQLIRQPQPIAEHQFEIEFEAPDVQAFDFTFG